MTPLVLLLLAAQPQVDCDNAVTQTDMNICAAREYEQADRGLNAAWDRATRQAKAVDADRAARGEQGGVSDRLLRAQRAWLTFRDAHCDAISHRYRGGSIQPLIQSDCLTRITRARTEQLHELSESD